MNRHETYSGGQPNSEFRIQNSEFGPRRAYTMAELMIVVIIMIMLVAATMPIAKKVMDDSHVREASRQLNAYLQMAKARAVHTGRPCGLYLDCQAPLGHTDPMNLQPVDAVVRAVTELHLAEVPAPYAGALLDSVAKVSATGYFQPWNVGTNQPDPNEFAQLKSLLTPGESFQVRFDYKGGWYNFTYLQNANDPDTFQYIGTLSNVSPPTTRAVPFQIRRAPRKVGNPLALPTGTCIDMRYSGVGPTADKFPVQPYRALTILFTPNGGVDDLIGVIQNGTSQHVVPNGTLYFLIGKIDKVNDPLRVNFYDIRDSNLADPTSLWVTVGRGNGQVTTSENTPDSNPALQSQPAAYLRAARQVATSREQMKGR
jgi:type II secretory pathway pseudopilin PulG